MKTLDKMMEPLYLAFFIVFLVGTLLLLMSVALMAVTVRTAFTAHRRVIHP